MGFFKKIWKGVKKTFKKIGKGVKKAFTKFGKFMGKAGILGTVAIGILTGGAGFGAMLGNFGTFLGSAGASLGGVAGSVLNGASWVVGKAVQFGNMVTSGFKTLTGGVTEFFGQAGKYIGGKLGMPGLDNITIGEAWDQYSAQLVDNFDVFKQDLVALGGRSAGLSVPTGTSGFPTPDADTEAFMEAGPSGVPAGDITDQDIYTKGTASSSGSPANMSPVGVDTTIVDDTVSAFRKQVKDEVVAETAETGLGSLLSPKKIGEGIVEGVASAPERVVSTYLTQQAMMAIDPPPEMQPMLGSYQAPYFTSGDQYGAVSRGLSPVVSQTFEDYLVGYDSGIDYGAYGASSLYKNRLSAFA